MPDDKMESLTHFLKRMAASIDDGSSDSELVARIIQRKDESAFRSIVRRHAPMVHGVCRRVLQDIHDAEDAFQATFLVLAQKPAAVDDPARLANWLYGVAFRTAQNAKRQFARQRRKELEAVRQIAVNPIPDLVWTEVRGVIDEEINRLPQRYRLPFVLCHLEGRTNEEAARYMGCPKGTIQSRLSWARERLRNRLTRRGVTLGVGTLGGLLTEQTASSALPILIAHTMRVGTAMILGQATLELASSKIIALSQGVLNMLWWAKVKTVVVCSSIVLLTVSPGVGIVAYRNAQAQQKVEIPNAKQNAEPKQEAKVSEYPLPKMPDEMDEFENDFKQVSNVKFPELFSHRNLLKPAPTDSKLRMLQIARYNSNLAATSYECLAVLSGQNTTYLLLATSARNLLEAEKEAHVTQSDRKAFLLQYVDFARAVESMGRQRFNEHSLNPSGYYQVQALRLDAEYQLLRIE